MNEMLFPRNYPMNPLLNAKEPMNILEMRLFWLALDDARTQITVRGESCRDGFDALPCGSCRDRSNGFLPMARIWSGWHLRATACSHGRLIGRMRMAMRSSTRCSESSSISRKMALSSSSAQVCGHSCSIFTVSGPASRQARYSSCSSFLRLMQSDCWYGCSSIGGSVKWSKCLAPFMWRICESFSV